MSLAGHDTALWVPFTRPSGPSWSTWDVAALVGGVREIDWDGPDGFDRVRVRILEGRLTADPRRAEFLVAPV
jgi:hypothetical protein